MADGTTIHLPDIPALDPVEFGPAQEFSRREGFKAALGAPMLREGVAVGAISLRRSEVGAFTDRQIELLESFAAQAVIAIENVRLFTELGARNQELSESLEQQTATAEILRVISQSPTDVGPVLAAVAKAALRFCGAEDVVIAVRDGDGWITGGHEGPMRGRLGDRYALNRETAPGRAIVDAETVHFPNIADLDPVEFATAHRISQARGFRATLAAPMLRDGAAIGSITLRKTEAGAFGARQIALLESFAAQAVIAIENVRLFTELQKRTDDLTESLEYQTATSEVLEVISRSSSDLQTVLDTMLAAAVRLCGVHSGGFTMRQGEVYRQVATTGYSDEFDKILRERELVPGGRSVIERVLHDKVACHVRDITTDPDYAFMEARAINVARTVLGVPLMREDDLLGVITVTRNHVEPFTERQIALIETFADQAVIAMENARLLGELRESLNQQIATAEILQVINASPGNLAPVFEAILEKAHSTCGADMGTLFAWDGTHARAVATLGYDAEIDELLRQPHPPIPAMVDLMSGQRVFHRVYEPDRASEGPHPFGPRFLAGSRIRTNLIIPLRKDEAVLGFISANRREVDPYSDKEISLLENFAAQAVIAMENARLFTELRERTDDLTESLEYQTATSELLEVISRSTADVQPVLDTLLASACRLCGVQMGGVTVRRDDVLRYVATLGMSAEYDKFLRETPHLIDRSTAAGRATFDKAIAYIPDVEADPDYKMSQTTTLGKFRSLLGVPLLREGEAIGAISLGRVDNEPFTERQIGLVKTFADQAVIAIENARLLGELRESLEQQTATTEILQAINASPGDLQPVFDAIVDKAMSLCDAAFGMFNTFDGRRFHTVATRGVPEAYAQHRLSSPPDYGPDTAPYRLIAGEEYVHFTDMADSDVYRRGDPNRRAIVDLGGARTILNVALRKEGTLLGMIAIYRQEVRPFTDQQIGLIQSFAAQAVIAMENARLLGELRQRTDDLQESLEYQTATSEVLEVIGRSTSDIQPVLDTMLSAALRLCRTESGGIAVQQGDAFRYLATLGWDPEADRAFRNLDIAAGRGTVAARVIADGRIVQIADVSSDPEFALPDMAKLSHWHTALGVPLMREGRPIGVIAITRDRVEPFTERQIALVKTFADQAVIAMENARLLGELRERTDDLTESLEYQTATSEVLEVISRSATDVQPVLDKLVSLGLRLAEARHCGIILSGEDGFRFRALAGPDAESMKKAVFAREFTPSRDSVAGRALLEGRVIHVEDVHALPEYAVSEVMAYVRTVLSVPLLREGEAVGVMNVTRDRIQPFSERQIALVKTFADQAVIAMENARLLGELRESLDQQTATAEVLQVINSSPSNLTPVFDAMLERALRLCQASCGHFRTFDGEVLRVVAIRGVPDAYAEFLRTTPVRPSSENQLGRILRGEQVAVSVDAAAEEAYSAGDSLRRAFVDLGGARSAVTVALAKDNKLLGTLTVYRQEVRPFSDKQIALVQNFAAQAVIAMENARLLNELRHRTDDLTESLEYQTATSEVLEVISRSGSDLQPVLDTMLKAATRLAGVQAGGIAVRRGDGLHFLATIGLTPEFEQHRRNHVLPLDRTNAQGRAMLDGQVVHVADITETPAYRSGDSEARAAVELGGHRSVLHVPLLRDDESVGVITVSRRDPHPFTERQIGLVRTFADQAVIAMENARLLSELRESLDQQTATSDVLRTISRSSVDLGGVLDALVQTVARLCHADQAYMFRRRDELHYLVASHGLPDEAIDYMNDHPFEPNEGTTSGRVVLHGRTVHIHDVLQDEKYTYSGGQKTAGFRTMLGIPLMAQDNMVGVFVVSRTRVEPFADKEIALATGFAAQAVIAIENARLFEELRDRQAELRVTFDNMGDGVVMFDAELKLASWNRNFQELLDVPDSFLASRPELEDYVRLLVQRGELGDRDPDKEVARYRERAARQWSAERTRPDGRVLEVRNNPVPGGGAVLIYSDITRRKKAETEIRTARDAAEAALERQTATADILKVIASSPTDVQPVLDEVVKAAVRFCGATDVVIHLRDGNDAISAAHEGTLPALLGRRSPLDGQTAFSAAMLERRTIHFPDLKAVDAIKYAGTLQRGAEFGFRAVLAAPLLREGTAVGAISLRRIEPGAFTHEQIELLETFAAQAVIAIENVRLFTELRDSLDRLKAAQANLVQSEKMATLGQLTAGIAHEIKNPLNFVNNFASLSVELLDELKQVAGPALEQLDGDSRAEVDETMALLVSNLAKITEHGKRADGIVRSMLSHSRGGAGDWQPSDINALVEEALNLAYHGARAQDKEFNVTLERDFEKTSKPIDVVPQDVTRVFLNLFGNGFYAANKRRLDARDAHFRPLIKVATRDLGDMVEVKVRDNGTGIPPEVREKLFQPFFTTKPTGEGTGLGLSISYDIVTQQHGGTIEVESEVGKFTEFTVRLPRSRRTVQAERA